MKRKPQNDAPFVAFYDMCAVMFILPDKMADELIAGLQLFILVARLNHMEPAMGDHSLKHGCFPI